MNMNFDLLKKECKNKTLLGVGPVSKRVTKAAIKLANEKNISLLLIPSRRQVECNELGGGYVYDTEDFCETVKDLDKKNKIILARDHGGPYQGSKVSPNLTQEMENAKLSYYYDIQYGFDILHLDPSINGNGFDDVVFKIKELYEYCENVAKEKNRDLLYEIGTEEHGSNSSLKITDFEKLVEICKKDLPKVKFVVGDTGPFVKETQNVGNFGADNAILMSTLCDKNDLFLKEHNLDYTNFRTLSLHPNLGIQSANVAPEFGTEETRTFLNELIDNGMHYEYEEFLEICYKSTKWQKWMKELPQKNYDLRHLATICGHYLMENERVKQIINKLNVSTNYNEVVDAHLQAVISKYLQAFGWLK